MQSFKTDSVVDATPVADAGLGRAGRDGVAGARGVGGLALPVHGIPVPARPRAP